jgi:hypothetical protein
MLKNQANTENNIVGCKNHHEEYSLGLVIFALIEYNAPRFKTRKYIV